MVFTFFDLVKFDKQNNKLFDILSLEEKFYYCLCYADGINPDDLEAVTKNDLIIAQAFKALDWDYWKDEKLQCYEQEEKMHLGLPSCPVSARR